MPITAPKTRSLASHGNPTQDMRRQLVIRRQLRGGPVINSGFIPLVRAKGFGPFPALLEERAGERALYETFEAEGMPVGLRDSPTTPMPLSAMMALLSRAARRLGDRTFGLEVGERMTHRGYGLWIEYCAAAETLGEALRRATTTSWAQQSGCRLELAADGALRTLRFMAPRTGVSETQHADHLLRPMLTFARLYLGRKWKPDWVEVTYARDPDAGLVEDRLQIPVRFNCQGTGIVLRGTDLTHMRPLGTGSSGRIVTLRDVRAEVLLMDAPEPARALSSMVALRLLDGRSDIEGAARAVGLSVQGL